MSKSKGNFHTLRDLLNKGHNPIAIRYLLLSTHYRDPLNFTDKSLVQAENTVKNYNAFYQAMDFCKTEKEDNSIRPAIEKARKVFTEGLNEDLNISLALSGIFNLIKTANIALTDGAIGVKEAADIKSFLEEIDSVLAILDTEKTELTEEERNLITERGSARKDKNFKKADEIRDKLKAKKIILEDTPYGTRWKRT
jgi:cysteinyl-tRNA synthetase